MLYTEQYLLRKLPTKMLRIASCAGEVQFCSKCELSAEIIA